MSRGANKQGAATARHVPCVPWKGATTTCTGIRHQRHPATNVVQMWTRNTPGSGVNEASVQGYLARKKPSPPLATLQELMHGPTVRSYGIAVPHKRGTPALHRVDPTSAVTLALRAEGLDLMNCRHCGVVDWQDAGWRLRSAPPTPPSLPLRS